MRELLFLFLWLLTRTKGTDYSIIPSSLYRDQSTNRIFYTVNVYIGSPSTQYNLIVDFDGDRFTTYKPLSYVSGSYSSVNGGSDLIQISGRMYRLPHSVTTLASGYRTICPTCDGTIGFGRHSVIWSLWPSISFSPNTILLGDFNIAFQTAFGCKTFLVDCDKTDNNGLCTTSVTVDSIDYVARITSEDTTSLPLSLYDSFVGSRNLYQTSEWPPFVIKFLNSSEDSLLSQHSDGFNAFGGCAAYPYLVLDSEAAIQYTTSGFGIVNIKENLVSDVLLIGVNTWNDFILHMDSINRQLIIKVYPHNNHISPWNLVLFSLALWCFIRWKMTSTYLTPFSRKDAGSHNMVTILYMMVSIPMSFYALFSPSTSEILRDYPHVQIFTFLIMCVMTVIVCFCWASMSGVSVNDVRTTFRINTTKDAAFEHILLMAMWLFLSERRLDGLSTLPTFILNVAALYNLVYYYIVTFTYFMYVGDDQLSTDILFLAFWGAILPGVMFYQSYLTYHYFARPFMATILSHVSPEFIPFIFVGCVMFITNVAAYMTMMYSSKAMYSVVENQNKNTVL